jgi:hypothetical protein
VTGAVVADAPAVAGVPTVVALMMLLVVLLLLSSRAAAGVVFLRCVRSAFFLC